MPLLILALLFLTSALAPGQLPAPTDEQITPEAKKKAVDMTVMLLSQTLSLTPDQQAQIKPILQEKFKKAEEIHNDASLSDEQKQAKWKDLFESGRTQVDAILNPQQKAQLDQLAALYSQQKNLPGIPSGN